MPPCAPLGPALQPLEVPAPGRRGGRHRGPRHGRERDPDLPLPPRQLPQGDRGARARGFPKEANELFILRMIFFNHILFLLLDFILTWLSNN